MIKSIEIENYLGDVLEVVLTDAEPEHGLLLTGMTGIGSPAADINTTQLASADGSLFNSARANERNITLKFKFGFAPDIETSRQRTYKYFPVKKQIKLTVNADNRSLYITGYVENNEPDIFSEKEGCTISILCDYPFFYSAHNDGLNDETFSGTVSMFEFPFSNESLDQPLLEFGSIKEEYEENIYYDGDIETGVVITMHATDLVKMITIYNARTKGVMKIDTDKITEIVGSPFSTGDDIIIDTNRGAKTVKLLRSGHYYNILNCLRRDAQWFTLSKGDNIFAYAADEGVDYLQFKLEYRTVFEGV